MNSTVPSPRPMRPPVEPGCASFSAAALAGARFVHPAAASAPDEAALATWWRRFHDPELDRLIDATVGQGYEVCAAALRLRSRCERGPAGDAAADHAEAVDEAALCDFYSVWLRQTATAARHYLLASSLQERIACVDAAIAGETRAMRRAGRHEDREAAAMPGGDAHPAMLADLHAHRIRLRAQWDAAVIALAHLSAQPLPLLIARLGDRGLPAACAETPAFGGPERVLLRRPDVRAERAHAARAHAVNANAADANAADSNNDRYAARLASLACEQREDIALKEVELALATLAAAQAELVPVRASAASAEACCQRLRRSADPRRIAENARAVHGFRDREIETRGRTYLALVDVFHAAGCGWPALTDPVPSDPLSPDDGVRA